MIKGSDRTFAEKRTTNPSLVFCIIDHFTNEMVSGAVHISLRPASHTAVEVEDQKVPVRNRSGYYAFINLSPGYYVYTIECDHYGTVEKTIKLEENVIPEYPEYVYLMPLPSYPFPKGTTLLRGTVYESGTGYPLSNVKVNLRTKGMDRSVETSSDGQFALYFPRLKDKQDNPGMNEVEKVNGKTLVLGDGNILYLNPEFSKTGYDDDEMFLLQEGNGLKIETFNLEVGKELIIRKFLKKGVP